MQNKSFNSMRCPIARTLDRVGEWWSILILREAMQGPARFDDLQKSLGIAPSTLTRRLDKLVEDGLLEKRLYQARPARYEYALTACGEDFRPVVWSMLAWSNRHFAPEGPSLVIVDHDTGAWADPVLVDRFTGQRLERPRFEVAVTPAADAALQSRYSLKSERPGSLPVRKVSTSHQDA